MKKLLLTTAAVGVLGVSSLAGVGIASAYQGSGNHDDLISKIAQKFNLDTNEVQQVFDEEHAARQAEMEQDLKSKLDQAVTDGKLNQDQADQLFTKKQELADFRHTLTDKSSEERREALRQKHEEFRQWAQDNEIDLSGLRDYIGNGFGNGPGRGMRNNAL